MDEHDSQAARFTAKTENRLRKAGWYPGRRYDISAYHTAWCRLGMAAHPRAVAFLEEFGGIELPFRTQPKTFLAKLFPDYVTMGFHVEWSAGDESCHQFYEQRLGPLCEIGIWFDFNTAIIITMATEGNVFGHWHDPPYCGDAAKEPLFYFGASGDEAIENLVHSRWAMFVEEIPVGELPVQCRYPE